MNLQQKTCIPTGLKPYRPNKQMLTEPGKSTSFPTMEIVPIKRPAIAKKGQSNALLGMYEITHMHIWW